MNPTQQVDMTLNQFVNIKLVKRLFLSFSLLFIMNNSFAASCCGGGASAGIILPKFDDAMWDLSFSQATEDGSWNSNGEYQKGLNNSKLQQRRLNLSYAHRLAEQWQFNVTLPLVYNINQYSGENNSAQGLGDTQVGLWYEAFERVTCVYKITGWESLKPSLYFGSSITLPTGISAYSDRVDDSSETTGQGFYRWDANMIIEKTVYPFSLGWQGSYGVAIKRPINQEYGQAITPYNKKLGNRSSSVFSGSYTWFMPDLSMVTATLSQSRITEADVSYDGITDEESDYSSTTNGLSIAYNSSLRDWILKLSLNDMESGNNTPNNQTVSIGVSHVYSF